MKQSETSRFSVEITYGNTLCFEDIEAANHKSAEEIAIALAGPNFGIDLSDHTIKKIKVDKQKNRTK